MVAPIAVPIPTPAPAAAASHASLGAVGGVGAAGAAGKGWTPGGTGAISVKKQLTYLEKMEIEKSINLAVKALASGNNKCAEVVVQNIQDALAAISN
jgi:hypothetical protein